jgi:hypothetical protein
MPTPTSPDSPTPPPGDQRPANSLWRRLGPLLAVIALSAALNVWNLTFPLGFHFDEPKKVDFVLTGRQDFHHPILLLELARLLNEAWPADNRPGVALRGRLVSALAGAAIPAAVWLLCLRLVPPNWSFVAALTAAALPIVAIHAHYFKEDVLFTACALWALVAWRHFLEWDDWPAALVWGLAAGLASAAHYKGLLIVVLPLLGPWLAPVRSGLSHLGRWSAACLLAAVVFSLVNWPALSDPDGLFRGARHELVHAREGHTLVIQPWMVGFTFHLRHSLLPGMGPVVLGLGLLRMAWAAWSWKKVSLTERLLWVVSLVHYLAIECSPSKPEPDYGRYTLLSAPPLALFAVLALNAGINRFPARSQPWAARLGALLLAGLPIADSTLLIHGMAHDTRAQAVVWLVSRGGNPRFEAFSSPNYTVWSVADANIDEERRQGTRYLVATSFNYASYAYGSQLPDQPPIVHRRHAGYERLFRDFPSTEFRPSWRTYAFSNPTVRIIDITRTGPTKHVWYYEQPLPEGRKKYSKTAALQFKELRIAEIMREIKELLARKS